nr:immunoglobulin heavy chain junction region [Macaca mulatta]MOX59627.1 immunoglobulin heavy chain junction region [Macaca mulatta]MOX60751.1 immunoglobulin heavy chain junction region [Macaca mulatta]MOX61010.1 immunoglobulin heavy chain junction region [Macaca mulatta]MOX61372.1 immunoglobulin heavy chain junction region [Macaca mulatta]
CVRDAFGSGCDYW